MISIHREVSSTARRLGRLCHTCHQGQHACPHYSTFWTCLKWDFTSISGVEDSLNNDGGKNAQTLLFVYIKTK